MHKVTTEFFTGNVYLLLLSITKSQTLQKICQRTQLYPNCGWSLFKSTNCSVSEKIDWVPVFIANLKILHFLSLKSLICICSLVQTCFNITISMIFSYIRSKILPLKKSAVSSLFSMRKVTTEFCTGNVYLLV